ncbi:MAG: HNH endonuclease [Gammaproteobacteria bacterium]|nr:HNH endonuclease [Gammaproteobacteria bacterium]MYF60162.1 HNH endonuclease [Gammaproteobacteria bacterium]MYI23001.1 HNH endonuclease [Gammaproteobacteria bacterium]
MKALVAVTDKDWFEHLRTLSRTERLKEVNFWTPKPWGGRFRALTRGQPLLFKLKSPDNVIAGGGYFEHYTDLPISRAWQAFGEKNGAASLDEVRQRTAHLRRDSPRPWEDYTIGCILLAEPFFWDKDDWFAQPPDWGRSIQRVKGYDLHTEIGRDIWQQVSGRVVAEPKPEGQFDLPGGYTDPVLVRRRVGQGIFRSVVTDVYERQCAVTREKALPALDAAHIQPFSQVPANYVQNGMLLRSDVHRLFDAGYVTVTPDHHFEVSKHIHTDFDDGENYYKLHGKGLWVPARAEYRPRRDYLEWHNENRFRG